MPDRSLTREEVRAVDRRAIDEFGMTGLVLMENAGRAVADKKKRKAGNITKRKVKALPITDFRIATHSLGQAHGIFQMRGHRGQAVIP